jgi:hypothetical protein
VGSWLLQDWQLGNLCHTHNRHRIVENRVSPMTDVRHRHVASVTKTIWDGRCKTNPIVFSEIWKMQFAIESKLKLDCGLLRMNYDVRLVMSGVTKVGSRGLLKKPCSERGNQCKWLKSKQELRKNMPDICTTNLQ